jgi:aspartate aminotransferase-like enzyme
VVSDAAKEKMKNRKTPIASFYANLMAFDGYYEKKWFPYTMPISDIYGLRAAFNLIAEDATLYERHARIGSATRAAVKEAGLKLHLQSGFSNTVTVFDIPQCTDAKSILDTMRTKYNIMLAGSFDELSGKVIRIGHMGENAYPEKVEAVMAGLDRVFADLGITLKCSLKEAYDKRMNG